MSAWLSSAVNCTIRLWDMDNEQSWYWQAACLWNEVSTCDVQRQLAWSRNCHEIAVCASRPEGYIVEIVQHRQHTWLGRVLRMDGNRLPKMSLQAHAHDVRCRGRPRKSWVESIINPLGLSATISHLYSPFNNVPLMISKIPQITELVPST